MKTRNTTAVWLEKYGRWQIKVTNDDGVRKTFTSPIKGRKGQTECNRKADEWLASGLKSQNARCKAALESWLNDLEKYSRCVTIDGKPDHTSHYKQCKGLTGNWIMPQIGNVKIGKLKRFDLQGVLDNAASNGLSRKTIKNIRGCISLWLGYCRERDVTELTATDLKVPKDAPVGERTILQPEELRILFENDETVYKGKVTKEWYVNAWRFSVVVGLRPGELIGIERKHINNDRLLIRGAINSDNVKTTGKNENAIRNIALHPLALEIIDKQLSMLKREGIVSKYLFPYKDGSPSTQDTMYKAWKRYKEHNGLGKTTPYELRHTFVSVTAGMSNLNIGELRATIGHSQNMDTLGTYSHALSGAEMHIASGIASAFSDILTRKE